MTKAIVRKWGNSLGVIIPKELMEQQRIKENDEIDLLIMKPADLSAAFGSLPRKKHVMTGQQFKNFVRK